MAREQISIAIVGGGIGGRIRHDHRDGTRGMGWAVAIRDTTGSAAALAARRRNWRRGSFMAFASEMLPPRPNRRMGGARRYPSCRGRGEMMGIAALYPSYT